MDLEQTLLQDGLLKMDPVLRVALAIIGAMLIKKENTCEIIKMIERCLLFHTHSLLILLKCGNNSEPFEE